MTVIRIGSTLTVIPATVSIASGAARSAIGPNDTPRSACRPERKLYAAMKNGICSSSESDPRSAYQGL